MAQFLGDIAFALWTALFAGGLILWHIGSKEAAGLVKFAAAITVGISIAGAMCTGYFWFKYEGAGAFENAYPTMKHMEAMEGMAMGGMMKGQMPMGGKRQESMTNEGMMPGPCRRNECLRIARGKPNLRLTNGRSTTMSIPRAIDAKYLTKPN